MINKWSENNPGLIEVLSQHFPEGTRKLQKPKMVGIATEIRTVHLPNACLKRCRRNPLVGYIVMMLILGSDWALLLSSLCMYVHVHLD
jgi:hypothetical protein